MGMYDEIKCERMLPDGLDGDGLTFQTKSFDAPYLQEYTITAEGRLLKDEWHLEMLPDSERPRDKDGNLTFCGSMRRVDDSKGKDTDYRGVIYFYTHTDDARITETWHEYRAKFTDGTLVELVAVPSGEGERCE